MRSQYSLPKRHIQFLAADTERRLKRPVAGGPERQSAHRHHRDDLLLPSPSGAPSDGLQIAGAVIPYTTCGACMTFKTSPGNIFNVWGIGPPGLYVEIIDAASTPTSPTTLTAEPAANGWIGGGRIGSRGEWNYNSGQIYPEASGTSVTACVSTTPPPLYTQYAGPVTVIMNASVK